MPPTPETPLELTPEQAQQTGQLSQSLLGVAILALFQGLLWIAVAITFWIVKDEFLACVLPLIIGLASILSGMIAMTISTDAKYVGTVPAYNRSHLSNTVKGINDYLGVYFFIGLLLIVVLAWKLLF